MSAVVDVAILRSCSKRSGFKHNVDIWIDLAEKVGFLPDFNQLVNTALELHGEYVLKPNQKYSHRELTEHWISSMTRGHMSLDDVAKEGRISWTKSVQERYPRVFYAPRIPIYYEHFLEFGERVKATADAMGIQWDVSRYKPLPGWYPAPNHNDHTAGFDLYGISYKHAFKTGTFSNFNAWLGELGQLDRMAGKIVLNRKYAESKGIKDGDRLRVENTRGRVVEGTALLSECIHPECVGMDHAGGNWAKSLPPNHGGTGVHYGTLLEYEVENLDLMDGAMEASPKLRVSRAA